MNTQDNKALVDQTAAAEILHVKPYTLTNWRCTKRYPLPYIKIGRCVRYRVSDLLQFMENNRVSGEVPQ